MLLAPVYLPPRNADTTRGIAGSGLLAELPIFIYYYICYYKYKSVFEGKRSAVSPAGPQQRLESHHADSPRPVAYGCSHKNVSIFCKKKLKKQKNPSTMDFY